MRAVTGPVVIRLVLQIAPSGVIVKHGSPLPRRRTDSVANGRAVVGKVTLAEFTELIGQ